MPNATTDLSGSFKKISQIQKELGCSDRAASDVWYLRTRTRHTPELEKALLDAHARGEPVNVMEFGCTEDTGRALMQAALEKVAGKKAFD